MSHPLTPGPDCTEHEDCPCAFCDQERAACERELEPWEVALFELEQAGFRFILPGVQR